MQRNLNLRCAACSCPRYILICIMYAIAFQVFGDSNIAQGAYVRTLTILFLASKQKGACIHIDLSGHRTGVRSLNQALPVTVLSATSLSIRMLSVAMGAAATFGTAQYSCDRIRPTQRNVAWRGASESVCPLGVHPGLVAIESTLRARFENSTWGKTTRTTMSSRRSETARNSRMKASLCSLPGTFSASRETNSRPNRQLL